MKIKILYNHLYSDKMSTYGFLQAFQKEDSMKQSSILSKTRTLLSHFSPKQLKLHMKHSHSFFKRLVLSYLVINMVWTIVITSISFLTLGSSYNNSLVEKNNATIHQLTGSIDEFVIGSVPDIAAAITNEILKNPLVYGYLTGEKKDYLVDSLEIKDYISNICILNPMIESVAVYFGPSELLITSKYIRTASNIDLFMGALYQHYAVLTQQAKNDTWYFNNYYPVESISNSSITNSINVIEYAKQIPVFAKEPSNRCMLYITIKESNLSSVLQSSTTDYSDEIFILDRDNIVVSHSNKALVGQPLDAPWLKQMLDSNTDNGWFLNDDDQTVISFNRSSKTDWMFVTITSMQQLSNIFDFYKKMLLSAVVATFVLAIVLAIINAKHLYKPLNTLSELCINLYPSYREKAEYSIIENTIDALQHDLQQQQQLAQWNHSIYLKEYLKNIFLDGIVPVHFTSDLEKAGFLFQFDSYCAIKAVNTVQSASTHDFCTQLQHILNTSISRAVVFETNQICNIYLHFNSSAWMLPSIINKLLEADETDAFTFFIGDSCVLHAPGSCITQACIAYTYHFIFPERKLIRYTEIAEHENTEKIYHFEVIHQLETSLTTADHSRCVTEIDDIISLIRDSGCSCTEAKSTLKKVMAVLESNILKQTYMAERFDIITSMKDAELSPDIFQYKKALITVINKYFSIYDHYQNKRNMLLVKKAQDFIAQNIQDNQLSLNHVASALGISSGYLSRLFKSEAGISFSEYISNYRLEFSVQLLLKSELKIEQIAAMLNYSSPQYYANRFKLKYGCTPKEYRMNYKRPTT